MFARTNASATALPTSGSVGLRCSSDSSVTCPFFNNTSYYLAHHATNVTFEAVHAYIRVVLIEAS